MSIPGTLIILYGHRRIHFTNSSLKPRPVSTISSIFINVQLRSIREQTTLVRDQGMLHPGWSRNLCCCLLILVKVTELFRNLCCCLLILVKVTELFRNLCCCLLILVKVTVDLFQNSITTHAYMAVVFS